jgi:hypothetical protein
MRINKIVLLAIVLSLGVFSFTALSAHGAVFTVKKTATTATLNANPDSCVFNSSGTCNTTLSWSSAGGAGYVQLWRLGPGGSPQFYVGEGGGAGNAACTSVGASGNLVRSVDTNYPIRRFALYPASDCTSAGANTTTKLDEVTVSGEAQTPSPQYSPIKGMFFQPETYTQDGASPGNRWIFHYFTPGIREQARAEMRAIEQRTGATHLVIPAAAFSHLAWPTPTENELDKIAAVINDVNDAGLKVILGMGHPYIVPRSHLQPGVSPEAVCGHEIGDVVNGWTLFWDIPECPENNIALSKEWYRMAIAGIELRLSDKQGITYIQLSGNVGVPFYTEIGMFQDGHPYLSDAQAYVGEMVPYLHSITNIPIGALIQSESFDPNTQNHTERFLSNVFAAVPLQQWDYLDIAWSPHVRMSDIVGMSSVLATAPQKLVLGDGKATFMTSMTQAEVIRYHFDLVQQNQLGGFWYWLYKDSPSNPAFIGLRQYGYAGENSGGWKQDAVDAFSGTVTELTANLTASPNPVSSGNNTTLTWSSSRANSCSVTSGSGSGFNILNGATSGSDVSGNLTAATTFAISCSGIGGSATASVTVNISGSTGGGSGGGTGNTGGGTSGGGNPPGTGGTGNTASLQAQIAALMAQIAALQAQLGITPSTTGAFVRSLTMGSQGEDVRALQVYLNTHGSIVAAFGPGSRGSETATFGPATRAALARFQAANNISPAVGFFGLLTRGYVNAHP